MRWIVLTLLIFAQSARAEHIVEQKLTAVVDGAKKEIDLKWHIGKRGFRLDATSAKKTYIYLFNGRVFFVCGQLSKAALDFLTNAKFSDAKALAALAKGACQEASTDFVVKFFLSPHMALLDETASDGLLANVLVSDLAIKLNGTTGVHDQIKCVGLERQLNIKEVIAGVTTNLTVKECHAPSVPWRTALGMELRKKLMMQPGGRQFQSSIEDDLKSRKGMLLSGELKLGNKIEAKMQTTRVVSEPLSATMLKTPQGFQMIDVKTEAMKAAIPSGNVKVKQKTAPASALIQLLLLGGNPASALINAGGGE